MPKKKQPRKPTDPFGHIAFSKSGSVSECTSRLSSLKDLQELEVAEFFLYGVVARYPEFDVLEIVDLPENNQDFKVVTNKGEIFLQITEIPERDYAIPLTKKEYSSGKYKNYISKKSGETPYGVDEEKRNDSIRLAIERKLNKNYAKAKGEILWLVIFSTSIYVTPVHYENSELIISSIYSNANTFISNAENNPFDQVWFTDMQTNPIRIWSKDDNCCLSSDRT